MPYGSQLQGCSHKHSLLRAWWRLRADFQEWLLLQRAPESKTGDTLAAPHPQAGAGRGLRIGILPVGRGSSGSPSSEFSLEFLEGKGQR